MKRVKYSTGMKATAIILQEILAVIFVICTIMLTVLFNRSMLDVSDLNSKPFSESAYFEELFQKSVIEILDYADLKKIFETNGIYDRDKIVYLQDFVEEGYNVNYLLKYNKDMGYRLGDLEEWSKSYAMLESKVENSFSIKKDGTMIQQQTIVVDDKMIQESSIQIHSVGDLSESLQEIVKENVQYFYGGYYEINGYDGANIAIGPTEDLENDAGAEDFTRYIDGEISEEDEIQLQRSINKAMRGKLYELKDNELRVLLESLDLSVMSEAPKGSIIKEDYAPISGVGILDSFLQDNLSLVEMEKAYEYLETTLVQIGDKISTYRKCVNKYDKHETNLSYWYYSENQMQPFTNMSKEESNLEFIAFGEEKGSYFYYNEKEINLDTNVKGVEEFFYEQLKEEQSGEHDTILVAVDSSFPFEDTFYTAREEYQKLQPWLIISLLFLVISLIGCLLIFIYLSTVTGKNSKEEQIHLCWFDKIKTEFLFLVFILVSIGSVVLYEESAIRFETTEVAGFMVMAGVITCVSMGVFLIFYLSFVRRVKSSFLWKGSLLYWLISSIQKIFHNWKSASKSMLFFGIHIFITLLIAIFGYGNHYRMGFFPPLFLFLVLCAIEGMLFLREGIQKNIVMDGIKKIASGNLEYEINTENLHGDNKILGEAVNTIGEGLYHAIDASMKNERLKADLITNVSHDIKTPLTSIINYVDLVKREDIPNERIKGYVQVLDAKSQRLKQLTEDLVEASKISSGNITLQMDRLNLVELVYQTSGEFVEKFEERDLTAITKLSKTPVIIVADGRRIWRIIENLYQNVAKYAMEHTRVYVDMEVLNDTVYFSIKNISEQPLNIEADELTERFIRGDVSRGTEGSGLGLSIARDLTHLMGGTFDIYLDGDLFKVTISFPVAVEAQTSIESAESI